MKFDKVAFWRASVTFWIAAFVIVAAMEYLNHPFLHPLEVLLTPIAFAIISGVRLSRETRRRNF